MPCRDRGRANSPNCAMCFIKTEVTRFICEDSIHQLFIFYNLNFLCETTHQKLSFIVIHLLRADVPSMRWDLGVGWGKTCKQYSLNMSSVLYYQEGNPNINMSIKWDHLPVMIERMTCPRQYFQEEMQRRMREQMEKVGKKMFPTEIVVNVFRAS